MFRTRDFVLIFVSVVFLLVGIGTTLLHRGHPSVPVDKDLGLATTALEDIPVIVQEPPQLSRTERLEEMRRKIAEHTDPIVTTPDPFVEPAVSQEPSMVSAVTAAEPETTAELLLCPGYAPYTGVWSPQGISVEMVEGARVYYRTSEPTAVSRPGATSTPPEVVRTVVLQLPLSPSITALPGCVPSDVVGIAQDGSLIRNGEIGLYSVFGAGTLIGYALDGFPIYGVSAATTDMCGGIMEAGQYRYYLSDDRDTVLNCFSATPARL